MGSENDLIDWIGRQSGVAGIGDDCCIYPAEGGRHCLSVDTIVEGSHFVAGDGDHAVGHKAAAAALSDLAAMGAEPIGAALSLVLDGRRKPRDLLQGFIDECRRCACPVLGGDTVSGDVAMLSVTVWGRPAAERFLLRSTGRPGDVVAVTGGLGGSLANGRHLRPVPRLAEGAWLARQIGVHAAMDLSDGLALDLQRLAAASGCGAQLDPAAIPVHLDAAQTADPLRAACCDGEDFELLVTVEEAAWKPLHQAWPFGLALTAVGRLVNGAGLEWSDGQERRYAGFEHRV